MTGDEATRIIADLQERVGDLEQTLASLTRAMTLAGQVAGVDLFGDGYDLPSRPALKVVR